MLPNVRLLIAATLASFIVLTFGFGVFAAFRVNNEPLARVPVISAPLQFVASDPMPLGSTTIGNTTNIAWGAPFGASFRSNEPRADDDVPTLPPAGRETVKATDPASNQFDVTDAASPDGAAPTPALSDLALGKPPLDGADPAPGAAPPANTDIAAIDPASNQPSPDQAVSPPPADPAALANQPRLETAAPPDGKPPAPAVRRVVLRPAPKLARAHPVAKRQHVAARHLARPAADAPAAGSFSDPAAFRSVGSDFRTQSARTSKRTARNTAVGGPFIPANSQ